MNPKDVTRLPTRAGRLAVYVCLVVAALGTGPAHAAGGDLDPSFSEDGRELTRFESFGGFGIGTDTALQADGKIVVVGSAGGDFAIARYTPDGALDPTFSGDGRETTNITANREGEESSDFAQAVAVQPDGRIVVAGTAFGRSSSISETDIPRGAVIRYNADGSLDTSFGKDGKVRPGVARLADVLIRPDGKLLVVGDSKQPDGGCSRFVVVRLNTDGSIDSRGGTDFGNDDAPCATEEEAYAGALQPNGKLVVAGTSERSSLPRPPVPSQPPRFAVARYRPDGTLDRSFSKDGRRVSRFANPNRRMQSVASGVAVQRNGRIVLVGRLETRDGSVLALTRYRADGSLDESFSNDGRQETKAMAGGTDIAVQPDGRLVVSGSAGSDFGLARYRSDGRLDPSFSGDGRVTTSFDDGRSAAEAVALQPDGRIVLAGFYIGPPASNDRAFALARYLP